MKKKRNKQKCTNELTWELLQNTDSWTSPPSSSTAPSLSQNLPLLTGTPSSSFFSFLLISIFFRSVFLSRSHICYPFHCAWFSKYVTLFNHYHGKMVMSATRLSNSPMETVPHFSKNKRKTWLLPGCSSKVAGKAKKRGGGVYNEFKRIS